LANLQIQPSINDVRSKAHLALINRLGGLDLSAILVYRIASLVDSAVLAMAWQWDVLNPLLLPDTSQLLNLTYPSWDQIANINTLINVDLLQYQGEQEVSPPMSVIYARYRALILLSTSLHSTLGTVTAIKNALAGLGYANAKVQEGQSTWGGTSWPSNEGWAVFRVLINLAQVPPDTDFTALEKRMNAVCNYWKPARCWLVLLHQKTAAPVSRE
jgi:Phage tail protein (Tail_P2_I)